MKTIDVNPKYESEIEIHEIIRDENGNVKYVDFVFLDVDDCRVTDVSALEVEYEKPIYGSYSGGNWSPQGTVFTEEVGTTTEQTNVAIEEVLEGALFRAIHQEPIIGIFVPDELEIVDKSSVGVAIGWDGYTFDDNYDGEVNDRKEEFAKQLGEEYDDVCYKFLNNILDDLFIEAEEVEQVA